MVFRWEKTNEVIEKFIKENKDNHYTTLDGEIMDVNPQRIIAINDNFDYPEILTDYKMERLKKSVKENGWQNINLQTFELLMIPNGDLLVNGAGNHRAVLSKELGLDSVRATVSKVIYI